jgi:hypothetical protein
MSSEHHPSCRPSDRDLVLLCAQCGGHESADFVLAALIKARETIRALHGDVAWEIYEKHSPEMKQIDAALTSMGENLKNRERV